MKTKIRLGLAMLAACELAVAHPAVAAGATRSFEALPLLAASVGSVPYAKGAEDTWRCVSVTDDVLKLDDKYVQVDEAGRVVLDPKGEPFTCRAPFEAYQVSQGGGFPFEIVLAILGVGGLAAALGGGGGNDSTG